MAYFNPRSANPTMDPALSGNSLGAAPAGNGMTALNPQRIAMPPPALGNVGGMTANLPVAPGGPGPISPNTGAPLPASPAAIAQLTKMAQGGGPAAGMAPGGFSGVPAMPGLGGNQVNSMQVQKILQGLAAAKAGGVSRAASPVGGRFSPPPMQQALTPPAAGPVMPAWSGLPATGRGRRGVMPPTGSIL